MASYFTRGSGHDERAVYSERADDYKRNLDRLNAKYETARTRVPAPEVSLVDGTRIGLIAYGTTDDAIAESRDQLDREFGLKTNYLRVRALPFTTHLSDFFDSCDRVYVVEQNRDAQMATLMKNELRPDQIAKLRNVLHYNGIPVDAQFITDALIAGEKEGS